ncbi:hypothetical protein K438DRAFT_1997394 [Mycena galopus ATCC 62051]|nr:hypothetical protein K438DRAFT_1997394 [Mycena galopus ATCC 62051]
MSAIKQIYGVKLTALAEAIDHLNALENYCPSLRSGIASLTTIPRDRTTIPPFKFPPRCRRRTLGLTFFVNVLASVALVSRRFPSTTAAAKSPHPPCARWLSIFSQPLNPIDRASDVSMDAERPPIAFASPSRNAEPCTPPCVRPPRDIVVETDLELARCWTSASPFPPSHLTSAAAVPATPLSSPAPGSQAEDRPSAHPHRAVSDPTHGASSTPPDTADIDLEALLPDIDGRRGIHPPDYVMLTSRIFATRARPFPFVRFTITIFTCPATVCAAAPTPFLALVLSEEEDGYAGGGDGSVRRCCVLGRQPQQQTQV